MYKIELIQALKDSNELSKSDAEAVVNLFFDKMSDALVQGERVEIRGLCSFFIKKYGAYTGRNPKTGELVYSVKNVGIFHYDRFLQEKGKMNIEKNSAAIK